MRLSELGEAALIERIAKKFKPKRPAVKGIGDDCAVIEISKNKYLLITIDMLLEDTDFRLKEAAPYPQDRPSYPLKEGPYEIGWKSLACGLSDIAAMGGEAKYAVISLGLPGNLSVKFIDELYRGIKALAERFGVQIIGGDTNSSKKLVIDVAVMGFAGKRNLILRSGAKSGDIICVTGSLGGSYKSKRHLTFTPRLKEARLLVNSLKVNSMIDISDGLSTDLNHIAKESKVGARIYEELIPISKDAKGINAALNEGEDFELLFTLSPSQAKRLFMKKSSGIKIAVTRIGEITDKKFGIEIVDKNGKVKSLTPKGFSHF